MKKLSDLEVLLQIWDLEEKNKKVEEKEEQDENEEIRVYNEVSLQAYELKYMKGKQPRRLVLDSNTFESICKERIDVCGERPSEYAMFGLLLELVNTNDQIIIVK